MLVLIHSRFSNGFSTSLLTALIKATLDSYKMKYTLEHPPTHTCEYLPFSLFFVPCYNLFVLISFRCCWRFEYELIFVVIQGRLLSYRFVDDCCFILQFQYLLKTWGRWLCELWSRKFLLRNLRLGAVVLLFSLKLLFLRILGKWFYFEESILILVENPSTNLIPAWLTSFRISVPLQLKKNKLW